eukprot:7320605-Ditylum_brightwellii.AAC.1
MLCMEFWTAKARVASVVDMTIKQRSKRNAFLMFILPPPRHEGESFFDDDDDVWTIVEACRLILISIGSDITDEYVLFLRAYVSSRSIGAGAAGDSSVFVLFGALCSTVPPPNQPPHGLRVVEGTKKGIEASGVSHMLTDAP